MYGIENTSGIARSINEHTATGGYFAQKNKQWKEAEEVISINQLKEGTNHVLFTTFENQKIDYSIRNVKISARSKISNELISLTDGGDLYVKENKAYVKGVVATQAAKLYINNKYVPIRNYEFETVLENASDLKNLNLQLVKADGTLLYQEEALIHSIKEVSDAVTYKSPEILIPVRQAEDGTYGFALSDVDLAVIKEHYDKADQITVQKLRNIDLAPLGTNIINVTNQRVGYRFLPDGAQFNEPAKVTLKYDKKLLPKGYDERDIKVLYFDLQQRRWLSVPTDSIIKEEQKIVALTDHFTDYIAGIIQNPESPETNSFTPTSISDIQVANPTANIVQIQPPTANQQGDGTLDFPITVPAGRNGLQPNLSVSYNNNGSSGIVGYGWDIAIPYISVDTKFGVPTYDPTYETESYLLNGEELLMQSATNSLYLPHRSANKVIRNTSGVRVFYPKVEGSFSKIERHGNTPQTYTWIIWDKSGTKYTYFDRLRSSSDQIAKWYLSKIEDKNKNYIMYSYKYKYYNSSDGNLNGAKELNIYRIVYNLHPTLSNELHPYYQIDFIYKENTNRPDATFNYRYGFKEANGLWLDKINVISTLLEPDIKPEGWQQHQSDYEINYRFNYNINGRFGKTLLTSIVTENKKILADSTPAETESYTHTFEYHDDVAGGLFGSEQTINLKEDFSDQHSVLNSSIEEYHSSSVNVGAGISPSINVPAWWPFSFGGTINFSFPSSVSTQSSPTMLLLDIDGDGLDDKVMKIGNEIRYRKNLGGIAFSDQLYEAHHIGDLGLSEQWTQTDPEMSLSIIAANFNASKSESNGRSRTFFADVNSDGLIDYVKDKIVYFNRMDPNSGLPTFTNTSELTPNIIYKEGDVDATISEPLPDFSVGNDLMDAVKVWVAPRKGTVNISGVITKSFVASHNGVRYSIEHGGSQVRPFFFDPSAPIVRFDPKVPLIPWDPINIPITVANPINHYTHNYLIAPTLLVKASQSTNVSSNIQVETGDHIYFRVNSSQIPTELTSVTWDPTVTYVSTTGISNYSSTYSDAFLYGDAVAEPMTLFEPHNYRIEWPSANLYQNYPMKIVVKAYKIDENSANFDRKIPVQWGSVIIHNNASTNIQGASLAINGGTIIRDNPETFMYVEVEVSGASGADWKSFDNNFIPELVNLTTGERKYLVPKYDMRENLLTYYPYISFPSPTPIKLNNTFQLTGCQGEADCEDQYIYMTARYDDGQLMITNTGHQARMRYHINSDGDVIEVHYTGEDQLELLDEIHDPFTEIMADPGRKIYITYTTDDYSVASALNQYQNNNNLIEGSVFGFNAGGLGASPVGSGSPVVNGAPPKGVIRANIATKTAEDQGLGTLYKDWGQFAYKGAAPDQNFKPINSSFISRKALGGVSDLRNPKPNEIQKGKELMELDPDDIDYDFDEGTFTVGASPIAVNQNQLEAIKHFTILRSNRKISAWSSHDRLYVKAYEMSPYLRYNNSGQIQMVPIGTPTGVGQYGAVSIVKETTSKSKSKGKSLSFYGFAVGTSESKANSKQLNDYMDLNGDGYPDIVGTDRIQVTSNRGGLTNTFITKGLLSETASIGSGQSAGGGTAHIVQVADPSGGFSGVRVGTNTTFANVGINDAGFITNTRPNHILVDLNGDGLADIVKPAGLTEFNTSKAFEASNWGGYTEAQVSRTTSKSLGVSIGAGMVFGGMGNSNLDLSVGFTGSNSVTQHVNDFVDINGDGLPDYIHNKQVYFNTGTRHLTGGMNLPSLSESSSAAHGKTINASFLIPFPLTFFGIGFIVKVGGGGGYSEGKNYNTDNVSLRDFDGDGYPDIVESSSETELKVRLSKIGRTNMLKMVHNPTGSKIELDYATFNKLSGTAFGSNYKMPFKKWVLSSVKVHDGFGGDGADTQQYAFEYENGLKDRRERKFLGFGKVKTHQLTDTGEIYRSMEQEYLLNDLPQQHMYLPGTASDSRKYQYIGKLLKSESTIDGIGRLVGKTEYEHAIYSIGTNSQSLYDTEFPIPTFTYGETDRILPLMKRSTSTVRHYQGNGTSPFFDDVSKALFKQYDQYGNVILYRDETIPGEIVTANIGYHYRNTSSEYLVSIPASHGVNNHKRFSTTALDVNGNIISIKRYLNYPSNTTDFAETNLEYDVLGNLTKVTLPKPKSSASDSERMFYEYNYDERFKQFVSQVTDAHGYKSSTTYNHFGMPLTQTDLNGVVFTYGYDALRRIKQFKGPYNTNWTIQNEYKQVPGSSLRYAVTKHNIADEVVTPGVQILYTSSFADGLGRIVQTKKQLDTEHDCGIAGQSYRLATSGLQVYDEFGRVIESYLGQEELDCNGALTTGLETYTPLAHQTAEKTDIAYDMQDRVIQNHVYGLNATTRYEYGFGNNGSSTTRSFEKVILPENNVTFTYKDPKGRVTNTKQVEGAKELITQYVYNELNELLLVIDAEGRTIQYSYDNFGQKIKTLHPDTGESQFTYDLTGKLTASNTPILRNQSQEIIYDYLFNQLQKIEYPSHTVTYTYGAFGAPDYSAGRLINIEDLTGTRTMKYGALGEVIGESRHLQSQSGELRFTQSFRYDSWGRIMEMTYPDAEQLIYEYNSVGQLKRIANSLGEEYLRDVKYNFFDQPLRIEYGNKVVTVNEYDITQRIRAMQLDRPDATTFMRNVYSYDRNQNITNIRNDYSQHQVLQLGGVSNKNYAYDGFNRLKTANGTWNGGVNEAHQYNLTMSYNDTHGIVSKNQFHNVSTTSVPAVNTQSENSYQADYKYTNPTHPHAVSSIQYSGIGGSQSATANFSYDLNGNMIEYQTNFGGFSTREMIWDEQNRLLAVVDDATNISHYVYDHAGERTFKSIGNITQVNIAGQPIYSVTNFNNYLIYPSGYMVVDPGKDEYSKHYYINGKRFVSRLAQDASQFAAVAPPSGYSTNSHAENNTQTDGLDINTIMGTQNTTYGIIIDNNEPDCQQQLIDIIAAYTSINNATSGSVTNCINKIKNIIATDSSYCEALIKVNQYICTPIDVNNPDDTTDPSYTEGEIDAFDCLTELNILVAQYAAAVAQQVAQQAMGRFMSYHLGCDTSEAIDCCKHYIQTGEWKCDTCPEMTKEHCGFVTEKNPEWENCIEHCLLSMKDGQAIDCWLFYKANGYWNPDYSCYEKIVKCDCTEFLEVVEAPDSKIIDCLRSCNIDGVQAALNYYDQTGNWKAEYDRFITECRCDEVPEPQPEIPIDRDMRNCALNCSNSSAYGCWEYFHSTGEWMPGCNEIMRDCGCYDPDDQHDCYRKALNYIKNELILEPVNNACAVLQYVKTHFKCVGKVLNPENPETPEDIGDEWDDDGGTNGPGTDGPYNESQRKPIWWYHTDHLGSSTYLTDNFGRPSHYYETLPFGEMMVEHNQSSYYKSPYPTTNKGTYNNAYKFNGKELDEATQMYYYGARYYDPRISIFVSVDPLAEKTMTPYQYVHNNPIMLIDPTGMSAEQGGDGWWSKMTNGVKSLLGISSAEKPTQYSEDGSTLLDEVVINTKRPNWVQRNFSRDKLSNDWKNIKEKSGWNHFRNYKKDMVGGTGNTIISGHGSESFEGTDMPGPAKTIKGDNMSTYSFGNPRVLQFATEGFGKWNSIKGDKNIQNFFSPRENLVNHKLKKFDLYPRIYLSDYVEIQSNVKDTMVPGSKVNQLNKRAKVDSIRLIPLRDEHNSNVR